MTTEEAATILRNAAWLGTDDERERIEKAVQMAANALQAQESCNQLATNLQPSKQDDLISRQEVIDTVHKIIYGFFYDEDGAVNNTEKSLFSVNKAICNGVRELPSAQLANRSPEVDKENGELISRQMAIQRCDTCKHEKEPWVNRCSDCFDYELWEPKDEEERWCGNESDRSCKCAPEPYQYLL